MEGMEAPYLLQKYRLCGVEIWEREGKIVFRNKSNISSEFLEKSIRLDKEGLLRELRTLVQSFFALETCCNLGMRLRTYEDDKGRVADFDLIGDESWCDSEIAHSVDELKHYIIYMLRIVDDKGEKSVKE